MADGFFEATELEREGGIVKKGLIGDLYTRSEDLRVEIEPEHDGVNFFRPEDVNDRNPSHTVRVLLSLNPWIEQRMAAIKKTVARQQERLARLEEMKARARMQARFPSIRDTTTITVQDQWQDKTLDWQPPPDCVPAEVPDRWF